MAMLCCAKGESMWTSLRVTAASGQVTYCTGPSRIGGPVLPTDYGTVRLFPGELLEVLTHRSGLPLFPSSFSLMRDGVYLVGTSASAALPPGSVDVSLPGHYSGTCYADPGEVFSFTVESATSAPVMLGLKITARLPACALPTGLMRFDLAQQGLLPCNEPYTSMGFAPSSAGSEIVDGCSPFFLAKGVVDWVHVELRDASDPSIIVAVRNGLLLSNGTLTDTDGTSPLNFLAAPGNYRIALMHRNHLGVLTDESFALRGAAPIVSFTGGMLLSSSPPFFYVPPPTCAGSTCAMQLGNTSIAGVPQRIAYVGMNNDRDPILLRVGGSTPTATISGYYPEDVNLDGVVRYVGENNDRDPILQALGGSVPTNVIEEPAP